MACPSVAYENEVEASDLVTPSQKLVYLKYMQLNTDFIDRPDTYPKLIDLLCGELNKVCGNILASDAISVMKAWVSNVKKKIHEVVSSRKNCIFSDEDLDLLNLLNAEKQKPSIPQLSCILDHLEIAYYSPKVWLTITLELEALGALKEEAYWKKAFDQWGNKVKRKKQLLDQMEINPSERDSFLNSLEHRLLELLPKMENSNINKDPNVCRICLDTKDGLKNIYQVCSDNLTIAQKISECANVQEADKNDSYPRHICEECFELLESAYKFKTICELSDQQLKNLSKTITEVEYVELYMEGNEEFQVTEIKCESTSDDTIEMSLHFDDEISQITKDSEEKDGNENVSESEITETELKTKISKETTFTIHQCEVCGIICHNDVSLKKHMLCHTVIRPHQCNVCEKEFRTKLSLRIHMRSHTGERPYVCETCGKAFKTWSAVSNHRAIHSDIKSFECPHCPYKGSTKANLHIHNRTHTGIQPYACDQCTLRFSTASNRHKHIRNVHDKLKSHKCGSCGRSFFSRESARKHMVIHTGLKPYKCAECPISYGWYNGLQKHMKTQHPGVKMPTEKHFFELMEKK